MKVGITFNYYANLWANGLQANAISLYNLIKEIDFVEEVSLIRTHFNKDIHPDIKDLSYNKEDWNDETSEYIAEKYDLMIIVGTIPPPNLMSKFIEDEKNRIVQYRCGNTLMQEVAEVTFMDSEIFNPIASPHFKDYHQIWTLPHHEYQNKEYYEIIYNTSVKILPYIWSDQHMLNEGQKYKSQDLSPWFDDQTFDKWNVSVFEPPKLMVKFMLPLLYSFEYANSKESNYFDKFIAFGSKQYATHKKLISIVNNLESKNKLIFTDRHPLPEVLAKYSQISMSIQHYNGLNNLYLDLAYFGTPLIHNSEFIADMGYYYKGFNIKQAGDLLIRATKERKKDTDYHARHLRILDRYNPMAEDMIHQHARLIENLWKKNEIDEMVYDIKTNRLI